MVRRIKAKLVLRLRSEGLSRRQIAAQGMSRHSVDAVIVAADAQRLRYDDWPRCQTPRSTSVSSRAAVNIKASMSSRTGTRCTASWAGSGSR